MKEESAIQSVLKAILQLLGDDPRVLPIEQYHPHRERLPEGISNLSMRTPLTDFMMALSFCYAAHDRGWLTEKDETISILLELDKQKYNGSVFHDPNATSLSGKYSTIFNVSDLPGLNSPEGKARTFYDISEAAVAGTDADFKKQAQKSDKWVVPLLLFKQDRDSDAIFCCEVGLLAPMGFDPSVELEHLVILDNPPSEEMAHSDTFGG